MRNLEGRADTGVSLLFAFPVLMLCCGGGFAKGFGGPVAPADRRAEADGEGGGSTTEPWRLCECVGVSAGLRGELEPPVTALPPCSEPPSGI